jgi:hypothetical protein
VENPNLVASALDHRHGLAHARSPTVSSVAVLRLSGRPTTRRFIRWPCPLGGLHRPVSARAAQSPRHRSPVPEAVITRSSPVVPPGTDRRETVSPRASLRCGDLASFMEVLYYLSVLKLNNYWWNSLTIRYWERSYFEFVLFLGTSFVTCVRSAHG